MKLSIRNLGVVKEADLDLKPLTVFIGPNNTGKSWVAYTLMALFGNYGFQRSIQEVYDAKTATPYPPLDNAVQQLIDEGNTKIDLVQFADEYAEIYFNNVAHSARDWLQNFMGTKYASFSDLTLSVNFADSKQALLEHIKDTGIVWKVALGQGKKEGLINALKEGGENKLFFYTSAEEKILDKLPLRAVKEFVIGPVLTALHKNSFCSEAIAFPVERTTITGLFHDRQSYQQGQQNNQQDEGIVVPFAFGQFISLTHTLFQQGSLTERLKKAEEIEEIHNYIQLAEVLEREILGGKVDFSTPEPDPRREILFQPLSDVKLDMPATSSMVKELTSLILYLRYLAEPRELFVIDEPEMNLHPRAQAQMVEFLALLVDAGLQVLITTHSPYILDHLGNLMAAAEHQEQDELEEKFYLKRKAAFISKENVSAYVFGDETVRSALDEEKIIDWDTFSSVSEEVSRIYFEM